MASIGGLSSNTSSGLGLYGASTKGFGGLASGMDTESLIEGMTLGTRTKIQDLQKKNQKYQWQMDAYRGISDMLVKFSNKYLDITSPSSPMRSSFFNKSLITASGANSKFLSVSGAGSNMDNLQVLAVKQMAKDASMVTTGYSSNQALTTGEIDFGKEVVTSNLSGGNIKVSLNNKDFTISMKDDEVLEALKGEPGFTGGKADYSTIDKAVKSFNAKLASMDAGDGKKLSDSMEMVNDGGAFVLKAKGDADGNLKLKGGSKKQLEMLGFIDNTGKVLDEGWISATGYKGKVLEENDMTSKTDFSEYFAEKTLTITYNGISKVIKMPSKEKLEEWMGNKKNLAEADVATKKTAVGNLKTYLQDQVNAAFGSGKILVGEDASGTLSSLSFKTGKLDGNGNEVLDKSSVLKISTGSAGMLGETGLFGIDPGTSNRINMGASLENSGLAGLTADKLKDYANDEGEIFLEINGKTIGGLTVNSSMGDIVNAINTSDAGVKVSYLETADRFSITSTIKGAAGEIAFKSDATENETAVAGKFNLALALFGEYNPDNVDEGKDAIMTVKYDGNTEMDIVRDSNSFNLDGATFNLNGTFGTDTNGNIIAGEEVSFTTSVDTEKIIKAVSDMVKDYNELVDAVGKHLKEKPDKNYQPLTAEQKKEMSKDEIETWEEKAKAGVLYNDSLLNNLSTKLRVVFSGTADMGVLKDMGLDMGNSYTSDGKITFDEEKFKNKLQEDPDKVRDLFTREASGSDTGGFTARLKAITNEFAKTTGAVKGSLIEKAGSPHSATSLTQNAIKKLMEESEKQINTFKDKLQNEVERHTKQFTALEKLVAQMNSQSSYLSSLSF